MQFLIQLNGKHKISVHILYIQSLFLYIQLIFIKTQSVFI